MDIYVPLNGNRIKSGCQHKINRNWTVRHYFCFLIENCRPNKTGNRCLSVSSIELSNLSYSNDVTMARWQAVLYFILYMGKYEIDRRPNGWRKGSISIGTKDILRRWFYKYKMQKRNREEWPKHENRPHVPRLKSPYIFTRCSICWCFCILLFSLVHALCSAQMKSKLIFVSVALIVSSSNNF